MHEPCGETDVTCTSRDTHCLKSIQDPERLLPFSQAEAAKESTSDSATTWFEGLDAVCAAGYASLAAHYLKSAAEVSACASLIVPFTGWAEKLEEEGKSRTDAYHILQRLCKEVHLPPVWSALIDGHHEPARTEEKLLPYLEV